MRYLKNFGLLLAATGILAACQDAELESGSEAVSEETNVAAPDEESAAEKEREPSAEDTSAREPADTENTDEQKIDDEKLSEIAGKADEIESYRAELNILAALDGMEPRRHAVEVFYINSHPLQLLLRESGEDRTISKDGKIYYNNSTEWIDVSESVDVNVLYRVTYNNAAASFLEMAPHMERQEHNDKAVYTYNGDSTDIYETLESLVQVNFGEMHIENVDSTVEVTVDKESKLIEEIKFESAGTDTHGTFELNGNAVFDTFNEVEEIETPEVE